jgi:hypothetical protein
MRKRYFPILIAAVLAGAGAATTARAGGPTTTVNVDATHSVAVVPSTAIGLNASTYDSYVTDSVVPGLVRDAGVRLMRFPGGTQSDEYDWKTNTDVKSGAAEATNFDQFMALVKRIHGQAMITVNYGTGNTAGKAYSETGAQLAADWVKYANVTHHEHIKYWEIGNEIYGNGTYGADWEPDENCATGTTQPDNCGPAVYAKNVAAYAKAMKAVDPSIKIGVVLTTPGSWPDAQTAPGSPQPWNQTVLSALGRSVDFADVHWYPQNPSNVTPPGPTDAGLLADTDQIPGIASTLRSEFTSYLGRQVPVTLTETNSVSSNPGKQTVSTVNALYLEQDYLSWISSGISNVDWWQLHNGIGTGGDNGPGLFGTAKYGDYGVLSDATCSDSICEPAAETPFPAYNGLVLLSRFIHPGERIVGATSSQALVRSYAVRVGNSARVMLVNDSPDTAYSVQLHYTGARPGRHAEITSLSGDGSRITKSKGSATSVNIPPYSITLLSPTG